MEQYMILCVVNSTLSKYVLCVGYTILERNVFYDVKKYCIVAQYIFLKFNKYLCG